MGGGGDGSEPTEQEWIASNLVPTSPPGQAASSVPGALEGLLRAQAALDASAALETETFEAAKTVRHPPRVHPRAGCTLRTPRRHAHACLP